ncbi:unnamed protein product [Anisakis simplex]|uniref:Uncharacterized protein n=1 Tax=Anisakis simplex TaxID=6269 RepID=A0A0M3JAP4_ANISI|nr:unnamed protein product [Anisakis simplex]
MAPSAPEVMSDDDWRRLLTQPSLSERVSFLRYLAITQYRAKQDLLKKQSADEAYIEYIKEQQRQFESGGMGYGPRMYQIMMNPLRNKKRLHQLYGARVWRTMRLDEKPHVVFDMQFIDEMAEKRRNIIGNQMQYLISVRSQLIQIWIQFLMFI